MKRNRFMLLGLLLILPSCATRAPQKKSPDEVHNHYIEYFNNKNNNSIQDQTIDVSTLTEEEKISLSTPVITAEMLEEEIKAKQKQMGPLISDEIKKSTISPKAPSDFRNSITEYTYIDGLYYQIYSAPGQLTDLRFEPGETLTGQPIIGDSASWSLAGGTSTENGNVIQHIFIRPERSDLSTTMMVLTDRRTYYFHLASYETLFMLSVRFKYSPSNILPQSQTSFSFNSNNESAVNYKIDPSKLNFNYSINGSATFKPTICYSDGVKTFIQLDPKFKNTNESPTLYIIPQGKGKEAIQLVNYRVDNQTLYIADTVINTGSSFLLKNDTSEIWITRI